MCLLFPGPSVVVAHENLKANWGDMNKSTLNSYVLSAEKGFHLSHNTRYPFKIGPLSGFIITWLFFLKRNWVMSVSQWDSVQNKKQNESHVYLE